MSDTLALYTNCRRCGGDQGVAPAAYGDHAWVDCSRCGEPVITWSDYKKEALQSAALQLRNASNAKLGRREHRQ